MKRAVKPDSLKYLILGAGGLGLVLRILLYATGIDGRGLLVRGHWAWITLWILTLLTGAAILALTRLIHCPVTPEALSPVSFSGAMGAFAAMAGIGLTTILEFSRDFGGIALPVWVLGLCSTVAMGVIGACRLTGRKPHPLLHALLCVYFALRMMSRYRLWCSDPQLQDYCFYLGAYVALMLAAYHHAALGADMGSHRPLWRYSLAAVYLGCVSLKSNMDAALLFGCSVWAFTNLTCLTPRPRRQRPVLNLDDDSEEAEA